MFLFSECRESLGRSSKEVMKEEVRECYCPMV